MYNYDHVWISQSRQQRISGNFVYNERNVEMNGCVIFFMTNHSNETDMSENREQSSLAESPVHDRKSNISGKHGKRATIMRIVVLLSVIVLLIGIHIFLKYRIEKGDRTPIDTHGQLIFPPGCGLTLGPGDHTIKAISPDSGVIQVENFPEKVIALTFDDGPFPMYTPLLLKILKKRKVKVSFFVNGKYARQFPQLIKDINEEGHEIGNHTYSHKDLTDLTDEEMDLELGKTDRIIYEITGKFPRLVRPPGGRLNRIACLRIFKRNYTIVMYSINPGDWWQRDPEKLLEYVKSRVHRGGIILLHTGYIHTIRMMPDLIDNLRENGYRFVTVSELARIEGIRIPPERGKKSEDAAVSKDANGSP